MVQPSVLLKTGLVGFVPTLVTFLITVYSPDFIVVPVPLMTFEIL